MEQNKTKMTIEEAKAVVLKAIKSLNILNEYYSNENAQVPNCITISFLEQKIEALESVSHLVLANSNNDENVKEIYKQTLTVSSYLIIVVGIMKNNNLTEISNINFTNKQIDNFINKWDLVLHTKK